MGLIDRIRTTGIHEDGTDQPRIWRTTVSLNLAGVARRVSDENVEPMLAIRDFLDQVPRRNRDQIARLIEEPPPPSGDDRVDAMLGGLAEHLALRAGLDVPIWALAPERFLDRFWFISDVPGFRAMAIAQSPVALKRRGIIWPERSMRRV